MARTSLAYMRYAALALIAGCSFRGTLPGQDATLDDDSSATDGTTPDAPFKPFGMPVLAMGLGDPLTDDDPTLTNDLLEIFWDSSRAGDSDIWTAQRASVTSPWTGLGLVPGLNTAFAESTPRVTLNGLTLYFNSDRDPNTLGADVFMTTRPSRTGTWSPPIKVMELSGPYDDFGVSPNGTHDRIVFNSNRPGSAGFNDLYESLWDGSAWGAPVRLASTATAADEWIPHLVAANRVLYFQSNRLGGAGGEDIYVAERPSPDADFGPAVLVEEVCGVGADADPWVSPDQQYMVFASNRSGNMEIYEAWRL